jgi:hypothetical protein
MALRSFQGVSRANPVGGGSISAALAPIVGPYEMNERQRRAMQNVAAPPSVIDAVGPPVKFKGGRTIQVAVNGEKRVLAKGRAVKKKPSKRKTNGKKKSAA